MSTRERLKEGSVLVGLVCFRAYTRAEPDIDISDIVSPSSKDHGER